MKIAIRGEGPTDIGVLNTDGSLEKGPMLILIEKLDCYQNLYNELWCTEEYNSIQWVYIHKKEIEQSPIKRKRVVLRGKKAQRDKSVDTALLRGFYNNSESFASLAKDRESDLAIFFVDSDKDSMEDRYKQVKLGLAEYGFDKTGVPMIPKSISESWLLCCLNSYQNCKKLEALTNDKSNPDYPKTLIRKSGKFHQEIAESCDSNRIDMPSFNRFREDFKVAINNYMNNKICK